MFHGKYFLLVVFTTIAIVIDAQNNYIVESNDVHNAYRQPEVQRVLVQVFYECLCPDCRNFDVTNLQTTIEKLNNYIVLKTYPYGNANTNVSPNGAISFKCQHGPAECYGNKLHACALNHIGNHTQAVLYNICMMDYARKGRGSDDAAADECGSLHSINSEPIKACAKGYLGSSLLYNYGVQSKQEGFRSVPHVKVNGRVIDVDKPNNLFDEVCKALPNPPPECQSQN